MKNEINIAELLKDCPQGMELDCTMFEGCTLSKISDDAGSSFPISIKSKNGCEIILTKYGKYYKHKDAKCVIFPKGKTTWEGFVPPCKFKVGDIIQDKDGYKVKITEVYVEDGFYGYESLITNGIGSISFKRESEWKLVPDKFDITTLKPYDRVLVRFGSGDIWRINLLERYDETSDKPFLCIGYEIFNQCIPYEGNEHLLGTSNDCPEYYKING